MQHRSLPRRILIVDDCEMDRVVASDLLLSKGFVVDIATNAAQAASAVAEGAYDLVLVKAAMRCVAEITAVARSADDAGGRNRAMIAATGRSSSDREATDGADVFIKRPLPALDFLAQIGAALASRAARDVWDATAYRGLERQLGRDRMLRQLEMVAERFEVFRALVANYSASDSEVAHFAHDVLAVGGILGFDELAAACRRSQAAFHGETGPARVDGLSDAIDRAISAASRAAESMHEISEVVPIGRTTGLRT